MPKKVLSPVHSEDKGDGDEGEEDKKDKKDHEDDMKDKEGLNGNFCLTDTSSPLFLLYDALIIIRSPYFERFMEDNPSLLAILALTVRCLETQTSKI